MLRTRSNPTTNNNPETPNSKNIEPDTPMSHYTSRIHGEDDPSLSPAPAGNPEYFGNGNGNGEGSNTPNAHAGYNSGSDIKSTGAEYNDTKNQHRRLSSGSSKSNSQNTQNEKQVGPGSGGLQSRRSKNGLTLNLSALVGGGKRGKNNYGFTGNKFGLSQKGWITVTGFVGLILLLKLMFSGSSEDPHHHVLDQAHLIPRDYLNNSLADPAPFEFCPVFGPGDAIAARRGQLELLKSRLHTGTNARVQRVLQKAMSGSSITLSVLGGSVSACTGAGDDPVNEKCYPHKFFDWWNTVFPHPANELTNGATKKTDSAYYAYCNSHHLPDKTDMVILEFDAADPNDPEWLQHFELLVRSILVRPEMPAVIILGHFSPQVQAQNGFAGPELLHNVVAQFYDVPHISAKGVLYEQYLQTPDQARSAFYADPNHANHNGHDLIADVLISYIMSQICAGWSAINGHAFDVPNLGTEGDSSASGPSLLGGVGLRKGMPGQEPGDGDSAGSSLAERYQGLRVPQMRLKDRPHDVQQFREIEPFCVAASDLINPLPPSLFYGSGWHTYHPPKGAVYEDRHYWYAEQPTARLRVPLKLGAGDVGIYFLQSPPDKPLGTVKCWVDDNVGGGKELQGTAEVDDVIATLVMIDRGVSRGSHFVECQLQGEAGGTSPPFKILGM
ncbi:uncharacterized protein I303_108059 [Kwoniella dejecticola CBS 10117]|uniref:Capsular associated protein n=1 Tax=Kwoniella dejecticola CBS 10117 TaxID=1296121 RepID=A0AAJ8KX83_9TREE